jgi:alkylation response protein AidB-like acyl-CoA dehydrogenase
MDFEVQDTPAQAEFRAEVRAWLAENIPAGLEFKGDSNGLKPMGEEEYEFRRALAHKMGERGWLFPVYPTEYGGGGLGAAEYIVLETELARYDLQLPFFYNSGAMMGGPAILIWGSEAQKRAFLPPMFRGETVTWQLLTEPHGGSDLFSARTTAIRDGDVYVVNGQKTMVGSTHHPDHMWTIVCTDPGGERHRNVSWLLIPADLPGISVRPLPMIMGRKNTVFFDNVRVPAFQLVGGENNGWKVATTHLEMEHGGAGGVGGRNRLLETLIETLRRAEVGGRPLLEDPDVRDLLADILIDADVMRLFGLRNFWLRHARQPSSYEGAQSLYYRRITVLREAERVQQILGYLALATDFPDGELFEDLVRRGFGFMHGGGTLDTDRVIIARRMGLGRQEKEQAGKTLV